MTPRPLSSSVLLALTLLSRPQVLHARPAFRGGSLEQLAMRILRASHEPLKPDLSGPARACIKVRAPHGESTRPTESES